MLSFEDFFSACAGLWTTERTYHSVLTGEIERSYTEFRVRVLSGIDKQPMLPLSTLTSEFGTVELDSDGLTQANNGLPGFAIAFDTRSETGEQVSMSLKALFIPDAYVASVDLKKLPIPAASQVSETTGIPLIQGWYLRDQGYSEAGAIAGRFTYQPLRQTLEMTTYYKRSIAVDQMRMVAPDLRLRTILTYQRPHADTSENLPPTVIDLVGFGVEHRRSL